MAIIAFHYINKFSYMCLK